MCIRPIYIKNKSKSRYGGLEYQAVPCRNCPECSAMAQNDYLVRTIALFNSLPLNYHFFFCTLTFRNEDLPRTNVYCTLDGKNFDVVANDVPCFNHQLYKRFRKNFQEYCMDKFGQPLYLLTTCEFGDKNHRPHYHCIAAVPFPCDWKGFKSVIERFWHYGFTKNIGIARIDGQDHLRSPENCIKYVTKYTCKFERKWLPVYLKDKTLCTDFPPYEIEPKTFVSNNYGAALDRCLSDGAFESDQIILPLRGSSKFAQTYFIPAYYRRRHFTKTEILSREKVPYGFENYPYADKLKYKWRYITTSITHRTEKYTQILYKKFMSNLRQQVFDFEKLLNDEHFMQTFTELVLDKLNISELTINKSNLMRQMSRLYRETHVSLSPLSLVRTKRIPSFVDIGIYKDANYKTPDALLSAWKRERKTRPSLSLVPPGAHIIFRDVPDIFSFFPTDYYYIQFAQHYLRNKRASQYQLQEYNQLEWYRLHHVQKSA